MTEFMRMLRRTFWFCLVCSVGCWQFFLGIDARRQMLAEALAWVRRLTW